jgi:hypothetical protein
MFEIVAAYDCRDWHEALVLSCYLTLMCVVFLYLMCGETAMWAEVKVIFVPYVMRNYTFISCMVTRLTYLFTFIYLLLGCTVRSTICCRIF